MIFQQSATANVFLWLRDSSGNGVTGVGPADILNGGRVTFIKADGSEQFITPESFAEVDSTNCPGLYRFNTGVGTPFSIVGQLQISIVPQATKFVDLIISGDVVAPAVSPPSAATIAAAVWDLVRSTHQIPGTMGGLMRGLTQLLIGQRNIDPIAGLLTIFQEDNLTALTQQTLVDQNDNPAGLNATNAGPDGLGNV